LLYAKEEKYLIILKCIKEDFILDRWGCLGAKVVVSKPLIIPLDRGIAIKLHVLRELQP